ncbi:hypothetical protein CAPTEDRAFT_156082 [Capitella teleta]|uniref:dolichyl-phosphate-mannose--protein mannosyltransferase n=1 Tax=Capitella teleta TaxID=283909 RepID=R7UI15_CAPTE|nr:hypothetical protein CAPTEDRAFT_156082 [Capitella teleta]|eukprot:ELU05738.1 hypothetical protein CAPTEDRAFT_156082 [Capitella teleta]
MSLAECEELPLSRDQVDGSSEPEANPSEPHHVGAKQQKLFTVTTDIDLMQCLLFAVALSTRLFYLDEPNSIVFDEVHFGRFAAMYSKNTFYFDVHPPLGKLMLAAAGYWAGFDGQFDFDRIGSEYSSSVPVWALRFLPALCGSLLVPVSYQLIIELGHSSWTALLASCFLIFDNAILTQSRFMLMEAPLLLFTSITLISYLKFQKANQSCPFSLKWFIWLFSTGVFMTMTVSTKYTGIYASLLVLILITRDFWRMLPLSTYTQGILWQHFFSRLLFLVVIPSSLYLAVFYLHLGLLNKAGPHDDIMSSAFQSSLQGGLSSITKGQPLIVSYGSQVTMRHTHSSKPCWLHSHRHVYPLRYPDERGSSHQQQVTCYSFKDVNNWWIIKDPKKKGLAVDDPIRPVQHGDVVQIVHGMSSRALNSHDVAAPVSPQHQEVTCYIDYNISQPTQNLWKVDIANRNVEGDDWKTIKSQVRLIHLNTTQALKVSGKQLPDWGFFQYEVVTDKQIKHASTIWNVEEHRYTRGQDEDEREKELKSAPPETSIQEIGFFAKFWELQLKMLFWNADAEREHRYSSSPYDWPTLDRNIAYWMNAKTNAQIHLLGNIVLWLSASVAVVVSCLLLITFLLMQRRNVMPITSDAWQMFTTDIEIFLGGYLLHFLPFFLTDSTLFLHHYLPALYFKLMLIAVLIEHVYSFIWSPSLRTVFKMLVIVWVTAAINTFMTFLPITYGRHSLSKDLIRNLQWKDSWSFVLPQS